MKFRISRVSSGMNVCPFEGAVKEKIVYTFETIQRFVDGVATTIQESEEWVINIDSLDRILTIAKDKNLINGVIITSDEKCSVPASIEIYDDYIE